MSCSCSNTPNPPPNPTRPTEPSFLDIVRSNSVTPPNATHKLRAKARVGDQVHNGTGLLTYTAKDGIVTHLFQFIPDDPKEITKYKKDHSHEWANILGEGNYKTVEDNSEWNEKVDISDIVESED